MGIGITGTEAPHLVGAHTKPSQNDGVILALEPALFKVTTTKIMLRRGGVMRSIPVPLNSHRFILFYFLINFKIGFATR